MQSSKQIRLMDKRVVQQQEIIAELNVLVRDIERCEKTITDLKNELEAVNVKHQGHSTTQENIDYLSDLLKCAKKKLVWEKNMLSLQKRAPLILEKMTSLINDPQAPPDDQMRAQFHQSLKAVQGAMERLQLVKME